MSQPVELTLLAPFGVASCLAVLAVALFGDRGVCRGDSAGLDCKQGHGSDDGSMLQQSAAYRVWMQGAKATQDEVVQEGPPVQMRTAPPSYIDYGNGTVIRDVYDWSNRDSMGIIIIGGKPPEQMSRSLSHMPGFWEPAWIHYVEEWRLDLKSLKLQSLLVPLRRGSSGDVYLGMTMTTFRVACLLSHRRALQYMLAVNMDHTLVLEEDAVQNHTGIRVYGNNVATALENIVDRISKFDPDWGLVNLGRCWDHCRYDRHVMPGFLRSLMPLCTQAYLVSRKGAQAILSHSLPTVIPIDLLIALLGRRGIMNVYSTEGMVFVQDDAFKDSHDSKRKPSCDPSNPRRKFGRDLSVLRTIQAATYRPFILNPPEHANSEVYGASANLDNLCARVSADTAQAYERRGFPNERVQEVLDHVRTLDLKGFIVMGFRGKQHTHGYIHEAIYRNFMHIASYSPEPMHVCWITASELKGISLTETYGYSKVNKNGIKRGRLGSSLVMATPKQMSYFIEDFMDLPDDLTSKYVFHDVVPAHFKHVQKRGDALQWVVWGPDGSDPWIDSEDFIQQHAMPWSDDPSWLIGIDHVKCLGPICPYPGRRMFIAPWATSLLPTEIDEYIDSLHYRIDSYATRGGRAALYFIGTIWKENAREFTDFVQGCTKARVTQFGAIFQGLAPELLNELKQMQRTGDLVTGNAVDSQVAMAMMNSSASFMPAIQGYAHHVHGNTSYISDRLLTLAATGRLVGTNNPTVARFFEAFSDVIVYRKDLHQLCDAYIDGLAALKADPSHEEALKKLMRHIRDKWSYAARFGDMLSIFRSIRAKGF